MTRTPGARGKKAKTADEMIEEAVATILNEEQYYDGMVPGLWDQLHERERNTYRVMARAVIAFFEMAQRSKP